MAAIEQRYIDQLQPVYNGHPDALRPPTGVSYGPHDPMRGWLRRPRTRFLPDVRDERDHKTRITLPYLRAWCLKRLLSQDELAERSGIAKSTVVRLEKGNQTAILSTIGKLAKALTLSREQLMYQNPDAEGDAHTKSTGQPDLVMR